MGDFRMPLQHKRGNTETRSVNGTFDEDVLVSTNLLLNVIERVRRVDGEANENDVGIGVGERAKAIVVFLTGGIPQGELNVLSIDLHIGDVVLEHGRDVDLWQGDVSAD